MTPQEESLLNDLIGRIEQTPLTEKDPEAEHLLNQRLARNPDALYVLAQTVLVQKYALEQAQAQLTQLRQLQEAAPPQPARSTSFLGNLLGHHDPAPPPPPPPPQPGYGASPYAQPWNQPPAYAPGPPVQAGGGSSFLRTAATTAAGVAAGALAFQGVESLLHGFGGNPAGLAGGGFFGGGEQRPEETVINNYYDDSGSRGDRGSDTGFGDGGRDANDLQAAGDDLRDDDSDPDQNLDDASYDDSSFDNSGGDDLV